MSSQLGQVEFLCVVLAWPCIRVKWLEYPCKMVKLRKCYKRKCNKNLNEHMLVYISHTFVCMRKMPHGERAWGKDRVQVNKGRHPCVKRHTHMCLRHNKRKRKGIRLRTYELSWELVNRSPIYSSTQYASKMTL